MELIRVQFHNILCVNQSQAMEPGCLMTKEKIQEEFEDMFHGMGKLE